MFNLVEKLESKISVDSTYYYLLRFYSKIHTASLRTVQTWITDDLECRMKWYHDL